MMILQNPQRQKPNISKTAWIPETAVIVGNVTIEDDVFVAPNAVIRADESGSSIVIGQGCNVQDNVVIHAMSNSKVVIGNSTSLAHGCIVHGPCRIGEGCFIGFGAVIFDCEIGNDTLILHNSTVRGVTILSGKVVPDGSTIVKQDDMEVIEDITPDLVEFKRTVINANMELLKGYRKLTKDE
ncbi:MAG: carbonate dehydratase [Methanosarcinaceae archaeon]|nr:carbonate dehydratase [Methanosarcinaceae archaeon]